MSATWGRCGDGHRWDALDADMAAAHLKLHPNGFSRKVESPPDDIDAGSLGRATLHDIEVGPTPDQLVEPFLAPEGVTVIYGRGGVGKGMVSIWLAYQLVIRGLSVMVIDYEGHPKEWARRARNLGWSDDQLKAVHYRNPFGKDWEADRGALYQVADHVKADVAELGVDYVIVDSFTTSTSTGDSLGGKDAAQEFFNAIERIGVPALVIAHVAGGQGRFPDKPFGSVFVHNLARETWAVERIEGQEDEVEYDPETWKLQPKVMNLELRNMKKNDGFIAKPQFIGFSFHYNGDITVDNVQPPKADRQSLIAGLLRRMGASTVKAIVAAIKDETGEGLSRQGVQTALNRGLGKTFSRDESKVPALWSVL